MRCRSGRGAAYARAVDSDLDHGDLLAWDGPVPPLRPPAFPLDTAHPADRMRDGARTARSKHPDHFYDGTAIAEPASPASAARYGYRFGSARPGRGLTAVNGTRVANVR